MSADLSDVGALDADADDITPSADFTCEVCDKPLAWSGRGFKPKYCADHKRGKGRKPDSEKIIPDKPVTKGNNATVVNRAISTLELGYSMVGAGLRATIAPNIGQAVFQERKELAESYRDLLETNAKVRAWFAEANGKAAWLPILIVHADLALHVVAQSQAKKMAAARPAESQNINHPADEPYFPPGYFDGYNDIPARPDGA